MKQIQEIKTNEETDSLLLTDLTAVYKPYRYRENCTKLKVCKTRYFNFMVACVDGRIGWGALMKNDYGVHSQSGLK